MKAKKEIIATLLRAERPDLANAVAKLQVQAAGGTFYDFMPKAAVAIKNLIRAMIKDQRHDEIAETLVAVVKTSIPQQLQMKVLRGIHLRTGAGVKPTALTSPAAATAADGGSVPYLTYEVVLEMGQEVKTENITNRLAAALASKKTFPEVVGMRIKQKSMHRAPPGKTRE